MTTERPASRPVGEDDLQAHVDGRLDAARDAEVREWLRDCPADAARVEAYAAQREALRARLRDRYDDEIPPRLRLDALRERRRHILAQRIRNAAAGIVLLLAGGAAGWLAHAPGTARPASALTADAEAAHLTFASELRHPVEVTASQEEHLVQWLSNRLGRQLRVPDLAAQGFRLMGGRLLPGEASPAAQFMYDDDRGTRLTLYMRADPDDRATSFRLVEKDGLSGFYWVDRDFGYAVLAKTGRERLLPVAEAVYRQLAAPGAAAPER